MSTSPVAMTCVVASPNANIACVDDATGQACVIFEGGPVPTQIRITSLNTVGFNMGTDWRNLACQTVLFEPQFTLPPGGTVTRNVNGGGVGFGLNSINAPVGTYHFRVEWGPVISPPCAFGTRVKSGTPSAAALGIDLLVSILTRRNALWLQPILEPLIGDIIDWTGLCASLPPPLPIIDNTIATASLDTWRAVLLNLAWSTGCECVPGSPTPTPPSEPAVPPPTGTPVFPTVGCDPADLCAALKQLLQLAGTIQQGVVRLGFVEQDLQRYLLPLSYVRGTRIPGLTGSGVHVLPPSVGVLVEVLAYPTENQTFTGAPPYIADLGWISALTPDGLLDEIRLTRTATTWLSKLIPSADQIAWALRAGVTIDITPLLPLP